MRNKQVSIRPAGAILNLHLNAVELEFLDETATTFKLSRHEVLKRAMYMLDVFVMMMHGPEDARIKVLMERP